MGKTGIKASLAAVLATSALPAGAASVIQNLSLSAFSPVSFDRFDTSLGTLTAVTGVLNFGGFTDYIVSAEANAVSLIVTAGGDFAFASDSPLEVFGTIGGTSNSFTDDAGQGTGSIFYAGTGSYSLTDPAALSLFNGTGSFTGLLTGQALLSTPSGTVTPVNPVEGAALDITYVYDAAVPEPASWMLMIAGFGLVGVALRRREAPVTA